MGKVRNKGGAPLKCSGGVTTMIGVLESNHSRDALRSILKGLRLVSSGLKAECAARLAAHLTEKPELQLSHPWAAAAITKVSNMFRNILKPTLTAPHTPNQHDAHPLAPPQLARSCDDMPNPKVVDAMPAPHDNRTRRVLELDFRVFTNFDDLDPDVVSCVCEALPPADYVDPSHVVNAVRIMPKQSLFATVLDGWMVTPPSTPVAV